MGWNSEFSPARWCWIADLSGATQMEQGQYNVQEGQNGIEFVQVSKSRRRSRLKCIGKGIPRVPQEIDSQTGQSRRAGVV